MVRLQIQLDEARHRDVKRRARRLGVSVSEVVRRCVEAGLAEEDAGLGDVRIRRALASAGKYTDRSGERDVAGAHDAALATAYRPAGRRGARR